MAFAVGTIVCSKDEENYPLRSKGKFYKRAVVVSNNPLVLVSKDCTMKWVHFSAEHLTVPDADIEEVFCDNDTLNACVLRAQNDEGEIRYDVTEPEIEVNGRGALALFEALSEYTDMPNSATLVVTPKHLITFGDNILNRVEIALGTVSFICKNNIFRFGKTHPIKLPVRVYNLNKEL